MTEDYMGAIGGILGTAIVASAGFAAIDMINNRGRKLKRKRKKQRCY